MVVALGPGALLFRPSADGCVLSAAGHKGNRHHDVTTARHVRVTLVGNQSCPPDGDRWGPDAVGGVIPAQRFL